LTTHTPQTLSAFSARVKDAFMAKRIAAPVHLCDDAQAQPLINIFHGIRPQDYVCCTWRSSFHAILKGIPESEVFQMILEGRSMYLMSKEHRFLASSIVGGILPIALGIAGGLKRTGEDARVWVFVGDMGATTGLYSEFARYASGHNLPVRICVENNGLSTNSDTKEAWGREAATLGTHGYYYSRTVPHVGVGANVQF
jgi:pyruvate dehydrogenase E1 component alpha subunit